jgi:hypothetical protein
MEYRLLYTRTTNDFHWILRAPLSVLVADRELAAIFAVEPESFLEESAVAGK